MSGHVMFSVALTEIISGNPRVCAGFCRSGGGVHLLAGAQAEGAYSASLTIANDASATSMPVMAAPISAERSSRPSTSSTAADVANAVLPRTTPTSQATAYRSGRQQIAMPAIKATTAAINSASKPMASLPRFPFNERTQTQVPGTAAR